MKFIENLLYMIIVLGVSFVFMALAFIAAFWWLIIVVIGIVLAVKFI